MSQIKVCFISHHFRNPKVFLNTILKMTPNRSGVWKNITAVTDPFEADYCLIMDGANCKFPENRSIYFGEHPTCGSTYTDWPDACATLKLPLVKYLNPGEWWITYDYDYLNSLPIPKTTKKAICIFTCHTNRSEMYEKRVRFMEKFCSTDFKIDIFGRPAENFKTHPNLSKKYLGVLGNTNPNNLEGGHCIGKEILIDYEYSLEFDVGPTINYFSERFYDSLLLWTIPIYWGSTNVETFIPEKAFIYVNLDDFSEISRIQDLMNSEYRVKNIEYVAEARNLLLNKYQLWAYMHDVVNNLQEYQNGSRLFPK